MLDGDLLGAPFGRDGYNPEVQSNLLIEKISLTAHGYPSQHDGRHLNYVIGLGYVRLSLSSLSSGLPECSH